MTTQSLPPSTTVDALPNGTELDGYVITGLIGQGGFGVVYVARDVSSQRSVAIKEYLPTAVAGRAANGSIAPRSRDLAGAYATGLKGFLREAKLLSEFSHPALVAVHRAWEQNSTVYMAMAYYPGKTLRDVRLSRAAGMTEAHIRVLMMPVFEAVAELHAHRVIHRDISPDNILVMANGSTVLLDLGAARQVLGGMTQALTTILKPGFAPIEQYVEDGSMEQGRWTDVYGLGAVIYFLATGKPPTPATTRIVRDALPSIHDAAAGAGYSQTLVTAVTRSLALRAIDRFKSVAEFRDALRWTAMQKATVPTEKTAAVDSLSAEDIRRLTAPEPEQLKSTPPVEPARSTSVSQAARPPAQQMGNRAKVYEGSKRTTALIPALVVLTLVIVALVLFLRR